MSTARESLSTRVIVQVFVFVVVIPFMPLLISRRWDRWEAWLYATLLIVGFVISRVLALHLRHRLVPGVW